MNLALLEEAAASPKGSLTAVLDPRPGLCCVALFRDDEGPKRRARQADLTSSTVVRGG